MRHALIGIFGIVVVAAAPFTARADMDRPDGKDDARWLPWIGCWEGASDVGEETSERFLVCFAHEALGSGVEILTFSADGEALGTELMRADGTAAPSEEGGCVGTRTATWSNDHHRVFLTSEMSCGEGVVRNTRGVLSMLPDGLGWVEIHSVQAGEASPLLGIRSFVPASAATLRAHAIPDPAAGLEMAVSTARSQAGQQLSPGGIVEAVKRVGPAVAGALVVERGEPFDLDAHLLKELAGQGVPGEVLDIMVAMSHPERFEITGSARSVEPQMRAPVAASPAPRSSMAGWPPRSTLSRRYSPWGMGYYDPFWSDPFFYGYGVYGYGYGGSFSRPIGAPYRPYPRVIVVQPPVVQDRSPRMDRDRGYVGGGSAETGSASAPRPAPAPSPAPPPARTSPPTAGSGGGSSGGDSSPPVRRAVPRP